ncbi:efflux RND transporter periplasmic adaptor subunit [Methylobacterium oryzihabitans]|uniref:Efflux RND transporter periplasmic adaptor subunit n=1 Tax=Methylobacterium oryzihabitans TaxID=2499852 RepID=A0A437P4B1_9HYPH|nr:efflux RND transporter periplasmic adaptor subunit [Methylobacterium oryzihabitans]RVU17092.1 efflux RND transporter periplasmic adaptor subunit [Methylobacterium oryzihabitans]
MADDDDPRSDAPRPDGDAAAPATAPPPRRRRGRRLLRLAATTAILAVAVVAALFVWQFYVLVPWTRDGRVRVQVAAIAPQVSGQITELRVVDNQFVKKGDVLYVIDPFDFQVSLDSAKAEVENRAADLQVKRAQAARREALTTVSTSVEEKQQYAGTAKIAEAAYASAQAQLAQAKVNLERTEVRSPVNGYVTNLLLRVGNYASAGTANISVVDADSYWIDGYFEETKMARIRLGAEAEVALMGYAEPIRGRVESITRGIATANAAASTQGLPNVDPVYTWVRLAQRVPVRIRIEQVPQGVPLVAGMTATVSIADPTADRRDRLGAALADVGTVFRVLTGRERQPPDSAVTTRVEGARDVSAIPAPEVGPTPPADRVVPTLPINPERPDITAPAGKR